MRPLPYQFFLAEFVFDQHATTPAVVFEVLVLLAALIGCSVLSRHVTKLWLRLLITLFAVLVFELFTGPMWINEHLGSWAYLYLDLSWVLTIGWSVLILGVVVLVDHWLAKWKQAWRFIAYLLVLLPIVLVLEITVVRLGIRSYSPEVLAATSGQKLLGAPIEILYYVPVFTSLIITFYKYWSFQLEQDSQSVPSRRRWGRSILIALIAVFLFELMIEPMIENRNFPKWSYVYRDISILLTGGWVLLLGSGALIVERFFSDFSVLVRFLAAVLLIGFVALVLESLLTLNGFRVYGPSMQACFTGFRTPITAVNSEIAFAIPCYLALIIAFIRFWETVFDERLRS